MENLKFLIVDDAPSILEIVKYALEKNFPYVEIDEASNGREAKAKLQNKNYDLIICDWQLPDLGGDQLLQWIRTHPTLGGIPFIMLTVKNEESDIKKVLQLGANAYITKPFTIHRLVQKITAITDKIKTTESERFFSNSTVSFRFRNHIISGKLIDISQGGLLGIFSIGDSLPKILEKVAVDIEPDDRPKVIGIDGFIIRIQAAESSVDSQHVKYAVKFIEINTEKKTELVNFLYSLKNVAL